MHCMNRNVFTVLLSLALWGCDKTKDGSTGPCLHTYEDPVIHIDSVINAQTGQQILAFKILNVTRDGYKEQPFLLKIISYNVVLYDSALVCNTPCGFGTGEGSYALWVSASGYRDTTISVKAKYAIFKGGCPSSNSGGTQFSFRLQPM